MPNSAALVQALLAAFCAILCALSGMGGGGMMIGARTAAWAKAGYTAKDYVANYAIFDSKENAGFGLPQSKQANKWKDCLNLTPDLTLNGPANWEDDYFLCGGSSYFSSASPRFINLLNTKTFTIEILVRAFIGTSNGGIIGIGHQERNLWMWERNNTTNPSEPYIDAIQTQFGNFSSRPQGPYNSWHSYVFVANGTSLSLYVDGSFFQEIVMSGTTRTDAYSYFGRLGPFNVAGCGLASIRFSDYGLSNEERLKNYAIDKARFNLP